MIEPISALLRASRRTVSAGLAAWLLAAVPLAAAPRAAGAGEATTADAVLYRVFLKDGGVLVSYGEFATVADRVVLSMPIGGTDTAPVLHLISIPEKDIEWEPPKASGEAARPSHYVATQAENDFSRLTREVADTLYRVG